MKRIRLKRTRLKRKPLNRKRVLSAYQEGINDDIEASNRMSKLIKKLSGKEGSNAPIIIKSHRIKKRRKKSLRMRLLPEFKRRIRERDGRCMVGSDAGFGKCGMVLHASHVYPTGSWPLLALYPLNCISMCGVHHLFRLWHKSPAEAWPWFRETYSQSWQDQLEAMKVQHLGRKGMTEEDIRAEWVRFGI